MACFFHFGYIAKTDFCPAADFYAYPGGEAGTCYQSGYIVCGKTEKGQTTGRDCPTDNPVGKAAFPRVFCLGVPPSPGGAGADRPGRGGQLFITQARRGKAVQRVQPVYTAVYKTGINIARFFFQFRFYIFDEGVPRFPYLHLPLHTAYYITRRFYKKSRRN
jgi:hypothetical protein